MPRLRRPAEPPVRQRPDDRVQATQDMSKGSRYVTRGTWLERDDPMVVDRPDLFEVRYRLDLERTDG